MTKSDVSRTLNLMNEFIKDPKKAMLHYRQESLRAMATGQKSAARYWRLAADAARHVVRQSQGNSILAPLKMPFADHFRQLALSLQKMNDALKEVSRKKKCDQNLEEDLSQKAVSNYQYWRQCLTVSCSPHFQREMQQVREAQKKYSFNFPKAVDYLGQALHFFNNALTEISWISPAYEAVHVANIFIQSKVIEEQNNHTLLENWEIMRHYAEQAFLLRVKMAEASEQKREEEVIEYSLAAFAMSDASESFVQMMKELLSEKRFLSKQWKETVPRALKIVNIRTALAEEEQLNFFMSNAASWLEAALEADLKRVEALAQEYKQAASYWEVSRNCSEQVAALYEKETVVTNPFSLLVQVWDKMILGSLEKKAQKKTPVIFLEQIFFGMSRELFPSFEWIQKWNKGEFVKFAEIGKSLTVHTWLYQTGSLLKQAGVNCEFFMGMPNLPYRGIVVTMSGLLYGYPKNLRFSPSLFIAGIVADDGIPHPAAMLHLIPNQVATKFLPFSKFIPHWPQPFLIPRDTARGDRFETIGFMGDSQNIAPELCSQEWHERLEKELGLRFVHRDFDHWHNFSDIDCVVAIRDFSTRRFYYKPAHKLYNAWLAGVPFIGGRDSAFATDGHPGHDYLVAHSAEEVFLHLKQLKEDPRFRAQLVENGRRSRVAFTREAVLQSWKQLVQETLPIHALKWQQSSALKRRWLIFLQRWSCAIQTFIFKNYKPKKYKFVIGKKRDLFAWASPSNTP